jgi:hypothetical protein
MRPTRNTFNIGKTYLNECLHLDFRFLKEPLTRAAGRRFFNMKKSRLRVLVGTITGHFKCNKHLFTIGLKESPICDRCHSDEETMYHLVYLCPTLANKRHRILGDYTLRN